MSNLRVVNHKFSGLSLTKLGIKAVFDVGNKSFREAVKFSLKGVDSFVIFDIRLIQRRGNFDTVVQGSGEIVVVTVKGLEGARLTLGIIHLSEKSFSVTQSMQLLHCVNLFCFVKRWILLRARRLVLPQRIFESNSVLLDLARIAIATITSPKSFRN